MQLSRVLGGWRRWTLSRRGLPLRASSGAFGGSFHLRHLDAGSCNACELELIALSGPHYDIARGGIDFVASPRHADGLVLTGPVTRNLAEAVSMTVEATPNPKVVIACGDCACGKGPFAGSYAVMPEPGSVLEADVRVAGCPPTPGSIIEGIAEARRAMAL